LFLERAELIFKERDESLNNETLKAQRSQNRGFARTLPNINSQSVWFFPTLKKSAEGRNLYEKAENCAYVYDRTGIDSNLITSIFSLLR